MERKTARQLFAEMELVRGEMTLRRCACGHDLHVYEMLGKTYAECKNPTCRRVDVTLEIRTLASLSNADLDAAGYPDYSVKAS